MYNFHTHTRFCDGSAEPEKYVEEAIRQGFSALGFSGHAPVAFANGFAIKQQELPEYCQTVRQLQKKYQEQIEIYLGMEIDYIPCLADDFSVFDSCGLDYAIGSVHLITLPGKEALWFIDGPLREIYDQGLEDLFNGDIRQAVTAYYHQVNRMIETQRFDVVGHMDKIKMHNQNRYFTEDEKWYCQLVSETIELIAERRLIVEVNTRGIYKKRSDALFPGNDILEQLYQRNIPIIISSDAHQPAEIANCFEQAAGILRSIGFKSQMKLTADGWISESL